jgi:hypothetical protein
MCGLKELDAPVLRSAGTKPAADAALSDDAIARGPAMALDPEEFVILPQFQDGVFLEELRSEPGKLVAKRSQYQLTIHRVCLGEQCQHLISMNLFHAIVAHKLWKIDLRLSEEGDVGQVKGCRLRRLLSGSDVGTDCSQPFNPVDPSAPAATSPAAPKENQDRVANVILLRCCCWSALGSSSALCAISIWARGM